MPSSQLPERPSLEYLKKLAKDRLRDLRGADPAATMAEALLAVARDHGFSSWRALKTEIDRLRQSDVDGFFEACAGGDLAALRRFLAADPGIVRTSSRTAPHGGWTGLHAAARNGRAQAVSLLLEQGADPNAREAGDNTYALHWAAAHAHLEVVRTLLDAGGDVHGLGDVHELDVIGWATFYQAHGDDVGQMDASRRELVDLLVHRGAQHHIFSAMSVGDLSLIRDLVEQNPGALDRRMSRFERGLTPLHFALDRKRYDILDLLIELGADVDARDMHGQTALAVAMLRADREAMSRLHDAGAQPPPAVAAPAFQAAMRDRAASVTKGVPAIRVPDVARTLEWYVSMGFKELARYDEDGVVNFAMVAFGGAELMLNPNGKAGTQDVSLWLYTDQIAELYELLKSRQLAAAQKTLAGQSDAGEGVRFEQDLEHMFYGVRQFCIRDLNGYEVYFIQPDA